MCSNHPNNLNSSDFFYMLTPQLLVLGTWVIVFCVYAVFAFDNSMMGYFKFKFLFRNDHFYEE